MSNFTGRMGTNEVAQLVQKKPTASLTSIFECQAALGVLEVTRPLKRGMYVLLICSLFSILFQMKRVLAVAKNFVASEIFEPDELH